MTIGLLRGTAVVSITAALLSILDGAPHAGFGWVAAAVGWAVAARHAAMVGGYESEIVGKENESLKRQVLREQRRSMEKTAEQVSQLTFSLCAEIADVMPSMYGEDVAVTIRHVAKEHRGTFSGEADE